MAKKPIRNPPKPKEFQAAPFGRLKGMVVATAAPLQPETPVIRKPHGPVDNDPDLFLQAVADVKPIHKLRTKTAEKNSQPVCKTSVETKNKTSPAEDCADPLFLQEIGRLKLDSKFADSVPDDGEMKPLSGNRLRQVKLGVVSVEHQLDLHGLRREEALTALPRFLRSAQQKGQKAVLVITGKGNHSAEEPILQQAVASWLREAGRELVVEFAPAPREMGGNGALVVFLRPGPPR